MIANRSVPAATVIPVLAYEDVGRASDWLCEVFGFRERLRIGSHRTQLIFGDGAVILTQRPIGVGPHACHEVHVRVANADSHYERARQHGAHILHAPESYPFGERQYTVEDPGGHQWTFSQPIGDVAPEDWGATVGALE
ncbi:MAG TPA: VOC family protein [Ktedonobacterales bacterium]|nr:VOC family protein [Ktedonobacterales bacterium]